MHDIWTYYDVEWKFITNLCGSVPGDPELIIAWLKARQPKVRPPSSKSIDEIQEEVFSTLAEPDETLSILVFQKSMENGGGLILRTATIRAHMKDCARIISSLYVGKVKGEKSFATKVINGVYYDEACYWTPVQRPDGSPVLKADGAKDKPIHVRGPRGEPINALKRYEFVNPAMMRFRLKVLGDCVRRKDLETLFMYGGTHGYGGERSDGEGRYTFTMREEGLKNDR